MKAPYANPVTKKQCPVCGVADAMMHDTRDVPFTYKGRSTVISSVTGEFCDACGESISGPEESDRMMKAIRAFKLAVDESL
jgi:HTH-type transcriptional regulator / antitoxin MqsA